MKNYIDVNKALEKILAIISDPDIQDAEMIEQAVRAIPTVEAMTVAEAKAMSEKAANKVKAQLADASNEIEKLTAAVAELTAERDALAAKTEAPALEIIEEAVIAAARWISVSEKLPQEGSLSIVFGEGTNGVTTAYYRSNMNMWKNGTIKFWMPMPEAPVEVSEEA